MNACEFNHGYTYSGHPMCCAVALENLRILEEEQIVTRVAQETGPTSRKNGKALPRIRWSATHRSWA